MRPSIYRNLEKKELNRVRLKRIFQLLDQQLRELDSGRDLQGQRILNIEQYRSEIRAAIRRIGFGIYGICDTCSEDIPFELLERAPTSRQCLQCREDFESALKLRSEARPAAILPFPPNSF